MSGMFKPPVTVLWRTLQIPTATEVLGVESDMNSEYVEFILPRKYQIFDLSGNDKVILVDTMNEKNEIFDTSEPIKEIRGEQIHLFWTVGPIPPNVDGVVYLRIRVLGITSEKFVWQTETAQFRLAPTFKTSDPPEPWEMTYFEQIILEITRLRNETQAFRNEAQNFRNQTEELRDETEGFRNEAEGFAQDAEESADEAARSAALAQLAYERAPFIHDETGTWYQWSYTEEIMADTRISAYGTRWFAMTESMPSNEAPTGARLNDLVVNTGDMPLQIGNLFEQPIGAVCRITQVEPFLVEYAGNIRGPKGPAGTDMDVDLQDEPEEDLLPEAGVNPIGAILQTIRNMLKWIRSQFTVNGKANEAVTAERLDPGGYIKLEGAVSGTSNLWDGTGTTIITTDADEIMDELALKEDKANKNVPGGYAPLDQNGNVPYENLPDTILGQLTPGGAFVPNTGVATLTDAAKVKLGTTATTITLTNNTTPITGFTSSQSIYYMASADGTFAGLNFYVGDWIIGTASSWQRIANTDAVVSVNGQTGVVNITHVTSANRVTEVVPINLGGTNGITRTEAWNNLVRDGGKFRNHPEVEKIAGSPAVLFNNYTDSAYTIFKNRGLVQQHDNGYIAMYTYHGSETSSSPTSNYAGLLLENPTTTTGADINNILRISRNVLGVGATYYIYHTGMTRRITLAQTPTSATANQVLMVTTANGSPVYTSINGGGGDTSGNLAQRMFAGSLPATEAGLAFAAVATSYKGGYLTADNARTFLAVLPLAGGIITGNLTINGTYYSRKANAAQGFNFQNFSDSTYTTMLSNMFLYQGAGSTGSFSMYNRENNNPATQSVFEIGAPSVRDQNNIARIIRTYTSGTVGTWNIYHGGMTTRIPTSQMPTSATVNQLLLVTTASGSPVYTSINGGGGSTSGPLSQRMFGTAYGYGQAGAAFAVVSSGFAGGYWSKENAFTFLFSTAVNPLTHICGLGSNSHNNPGYCTVAQLKSALGLSTPVAISQGGTGGTTSASGMYNVFSTQAGLGGSNIDGNPSVVFGATNAWSTASRIVGAVDSKVLAINGMFTTSYGSSSNVWDRYFCLVDPSASMGAGRSVGSSVRDWIRNYSSDRRLKTNIVPIQHASKFIHALKPVQFNTTENTYDKETLRYGFIAQDVKKTLEDLGIEKPNIISLQSTVEGIEDKDATEEQGTYALSYHEFIAPLVATVQEQQKQIDQLVQEVSELKARWSS